MATSTTRPPLDATGIILSTLCFLHCLGVPLIATGALAWVASEVIHVGFTIALMGVVILVAWPSYQQHGHIIVPTLLVSGLALLIVAVLTEEILGEYAEKKPDSPRFGCPPAWPHPEPAVSEDMCMMALPK